MSVGAVGAAAGAAVGDAGTTTGDAADGHAVGVAEEAPAPGGAVPEDTDGIPKE